MSPSQSSKYVPRESAAGTAHSARAHADGATSANNGAAHAAAAAVPTPRVGRVPTYKGVSHYTNTVLSAEHVKVVNINKRIMIYALDKFSCPA